MPSALNAPPSDPVRDAPHSVPEPAPAASVPPATTPAGPRRRGGLAQRLLGTKVADVLAGPHKVDHYLELLRPDWAVKQIRGEIIQVRHQNDDSVTLTLRPTVTWPGFSAGQHVEIFVDVNGVRHRRNYSPSGSADQRTQTVELTVRTHPDGVVSQHLKQRAQVGMFLGMSLPQGADFVLPTPRPDRIVLISGGSGITPVLAMLRTLTDEGHSGPIAFVHYARRSEDLLYAEDLQRIADRHPNVQLLRSYTREDSGELSGHFDREHLRRALPDDADAAAFVCGPGDLVEAVRAVWAEDELAVPLRYEHFAPPELPELDPGQIGSVTFARSNKTADGTARPLLEQAEDLGIAPVHGCRMGVCLTCKCKLQQGQVRNLLDGEIHGKPGEEVRICVSAPVGDVVLDL